MALTNEEVLSELISVFGASAIQNAEEPYTQLTLTVPTEKIAEIITWLRDHQPFQFIFLTDLCGVHYPHDQGKELAVVYHLHSLLHNYRLRLKVYVSERHPEVPSLTNVFSSANWMERETFDFFGIKFKGHPDLRRILNMEDMNYHPMLKQYPLEDQTREDKIDLFFGR